MVDKIVTENLVLPTFQEGDKVTLSPSLLEVIGTLIVRLELLYLDGAQRKKNLLLLIEYSIDQSFLSQDKKTEWKNFVLTTISPTIDSIVGISKLLNMIPETKGCCC